MTIANIGQILTKGFPYLITFWIGWIARANINKFKRRKNGSSAI